jgi:hypothetical protein
VKQKKLPANEAPAHERIAIIDEAIRAQHKRLTRPSVAEATTDEMRELAADIDHKVRNLRAKRAAIVRIALRACERIDTPEPRSDAD